MIIGCILASFFFATSVSAQNFCSANCGETSTSCTSVNQVYCTQHQAWVMFYCNAYSEPGCVDGERLVNVADPDCIISPAPCVQEICCTYCVPGDCGTAAPTASPTPGATATPGPSPTPGPTSGGVPPPSGTPAPSCTEGGPYISAWSVCSGSPAKHSRTVGYDCYTGYIETVDCTGAIQAKAVQVSAADTSCAAVAASTNGITGTSHAFTPGSASQPTAQVQSGNNYVSFFPVVGGSYTIASTALSDYTLARACWSRALNAPLSGEALSSTLSVPTDGDTLTWRLGYTFSGPWVQTGGGGNVYGAGAVTSPVSALAVPRLFSVDGSGGTPGLVTYGTSYDFDSNPLLTGETYVSSANWLANDAYTNINYYDFFYRKLGGMTIENATDAVGAAIDKGAMTKPATGTYYLKGPVTTSSIGWVMGATEKTIIIINESTPGAGDAGLTIGGPITITAGGFVAFIVNGNITVASSVGGLYTLDTPTVEGVYVTSPTGTLATSLGAIGKERLVGQGIFVAGSFLLQRDLVSVVANTTTAAELFLYNPRLLISMPDSMKDVPITWEEVAP